MEKIGSKLINEENQLIKRAAQGDQEAFRLLAERYHTPLINYIMTIIPSVEDAEDISQDTFNNAFNSIATFNSRYAFSTWLYSIARNRAIDILRQKQLNPISIQKSEGCEMEFDSNISSPEDQMITNQGIDVIINMIQSLPDEYREVAELRFIKDYPYEKIAKELNLPIGTIKTRINRARKQLRTLLEKK